ncbi:MAG: flagellar export chaperone FliS [candidate division Zixibacteria bacterium]|nr:flagellar export chaperone FliS [candidate division Zixibacteria bacterium]
MDGNVNTYRAVETSSKSQIDLILQVYDGALAAYRQASTHYKKKENEEGYEQLQRAKRFITHLYTTLNNDEGGEIATNLGKIYAFLIAQISLIEATKDLTVIDDNINILNELREGWQGLKDQGSDEISDPVTPAVSPGQFTGTA